MLSSFQYEYQAKYKLHDRWAQREGGPNAGPSNGMTRRYDDEESQEQKAMQMEQRMRQANGDVKPRLKIEKFEDDYRREGRQLQRVRSAGAAGGCRCRLTVNPGARRRRR